MRRISQAAIRLLALLSIVTLAVAAVGAAQPKRGWTKVRLTHAGGGGGAFPATLLARRGGELLVVNARDAFGYVPAGAVAALQADAQKEGIVVEPHDEYDVLRLPSSARVDTREGIGSDVPGDQRIQNYPARKPGLFLIQFVAPARAEWITELTSMGWTMSRYIHTNGYVITGTPELIGRTRQLPYIQFFDFYHPFQKAKQLVSDGAGRELVFELPGGVDASDAIAAIAEAAAGNGVKVEHGLDTLVYARLAHPQAEALLRHPLVLGVSPRPYGQLSDERQVMSLTSNLNTAGSAPTTPTGYTTWLTGRCTFCSSMSATAWRVGLADTGLDNGLNLGGHADLTGRKFFGARIYDGTDDTCASGMNPNCDRVGHGTIVAGLMVGNAATGMTDDLGYYWGMGVVPWAGVFSTKVYSLTSSNIDLARIFEFTRDAANNSVTIQNHSFNEYNVTPEQSGLYSALARQYDIAVRDSDNTFTTNRIPLFLSVSAGNNTQDLRTHRFRVLGGGTAKNVLSMGGAENHRPGVTGCNAPGDDFRNIMQSSRTGTLLANYIKPDLVAPAAPVAASNSSELTAYTSYCMDNFFTLPALYNGDSGTSFAAPVGAGSALIVKRYLGASPGATSPAMAKAMLIAGAKSIRGGIDKTTNPDTTIGAFPNGQQGFGRISLDDIITTGMAPLWYDQAAVRTFSPNQYPFRIRLRARDASKPVKAAVVWTDAPGTAYADNPLVNDLDLEIFRSSTPSYRLSGNYLQVTDPNKGEESTPIWIFDGIAGRDRTNNVEVIRTFMNANEEFDLTVNPYFIWGDTDGNTSTFEQDFALVVLNADSVNGGNPIAPVLTSWIDFNDPGHITLSWTHAANVTNVRYEVWRGTTLANMSKIVDAYGDGWNEYNMPLNTSYVYKVVAVANGGVSVTSNKTIATTISWWPDTHLWAGFPVRATHWNDLRRGVDYVRTAAGLPVNTWATPIVAGSTPIQASHLTELRNKLNEAYDAIGVARPAFAADPVPGVTIIRTQDVVDLRKAIE